MASAAALIGAAISREKRQLVFLLDPSLGVTLVQAKAIAGATKSERPQELKGLLMFDAVTSEDHSGASVITTHPIEDGASITDHSRPEPRVVTMTGIVSNRPIIPLFLDGLRTTRAQDAHVIVEKWRITGALLTLSTSLKVYENLMIETVSTPRNSGVGDAVQMTIGFREVVTVATDVARVPPTVSTRGQEQKKATVKQNAEVADAEKDGQGITAAKAGLRALTGLFSGG